MINNRRPWRDFDDEQEPDIVLDFEIIEDDEA